LKTGLLPNKAKKEATQLFGTRAGAEEGQKPWRTERKATKETKLQESRLLWEGFVRLKTVSEGGLGTTGVRFIRAKNNQGKRDTRTLRKL